MLLPKPLGVTLNELTLTRNRPASLRGGFLVSKRRGVFGIACS